MRKDRQAGTVRGRLLLLTLALLAAFTLLLAVYGSVMVGDLRERMLLEAEEPLQNYMQEFHNRKENMEQYLSYLAVTNDAFQNLSGQSSREALYLASDALQNELAAMAGMSGGEYLVVLYHSGLDFMLAARQSVNLKDELALLEERSFRQALQVELRQGDYPADRWSACRAGTRCCMCGWHSINRFCAVWPARCRGCWRQPRKERTQRRSSTTKGSPSSTHRYPLSCPIRRDRLLSRMGIWWRRPARMS